MTSATCITIEKRRLAALIEALRLARYALLRTGRRFDCPPHDHYAVAHTINQAIADGHAAEREVRS